MKNNDKEFLVEQIRTKYSEKEYTQLDKLKALDKKVSKPANVFAYVFGTVSALVLGTGMSFAMKVIGASMAMGIVIGLVGILMAVINYPIYKKILASRRKKYAAEIMKLSDELLNK
ncbi:MAG: dihydropteridine reductase [Clostridia bacterium]|nr:dihydropteridine reductase [Clostridia bacterium]